MSEYLIEHLVSNVLDFFFNNTTSLVPPPTQEDLNYKFIQSIGAIGTFLGFGVLAFQTFLLRRQTNLLRRQTENFSTQTQLLQNENDYNLRPWIYLVPQSDYKPIIVNIEPDKNKVKATIKLMNHGRLATIFRQGTTAIEAVYPSDLRQRHPGVNFVEVFLPKKDVTYSWTRDDEELMKEIFKRKHFFIGFLIQYHYTDRVRDERMIGRYEVVFMVNINLSDPDESGQRRIISHTVGISHEDVE